MNAIPLDEESRAYDAAPSKTEKVKATNADTNIESSVVNRECDVIWFYVTAPGEDLYYTKDIKSGEVKMHMIANAPPGVVTNWVGTEQDVHDWPIEQKAPILRELKGGSILDYASQKIDPKATLLGNRWLCRRGGAFVVAPSGMGKSSFSMQAAAQWAVGREAFGISPNGKPLKILIVQAEDDDGDCTEMARVIKHLGFSNSEKDLLSVNTHIEHVNDVCGEGFIKHLDCFLEQYPADLVIINPFTAYLGGDDKDAKLCATG